MELNLAVWQFNADHLHPLLALSIDTAREAKTSEFLLVDLASLELSDFFR
jgi:hypothetical protein